MYLGLRRTGQCQSLLYSKSEENTQSAVLLSNIEYQYFIMVENIFIIFHIFQLLTQIKNNILDVKVEKLKYQRV